MLSPVNAQVFWKCQWYKCSLSFVHCSPFFRQLIATAIVGELSLERNTGTQSPGLLTPPSNASKSSLTLCYGPELSIGSTPAALRLLANLAPAAELLGESAIDSACVDGWLSFDTTSVEVAVEAKDSEGFSQSMAYLEQHLANCTFLVGQGVTVADVSLVCSLYSAIQSGFWNLDAEKLPKITGWYNNITHQPWFVESTKALAGSLISSSLTPAAVTESSKGIFLSGEAPPVINDKYRRYRIRIKEVLKENGARVMNQTITVAGWAKTIRKASSKLFFVELNDGSTGSSLQCVLDVTVTEGFEGCKANGGTGASFEFTGEIVPSKGEEQVVDMKVTKAKLLGAVYGGNVEGTEVGGMLYPLSKKEHTLEHLRDIAHLRSRGSVHAAAMRIRHAMAYATHHFFNSHGFLYIHTPIITGADCEGAGEQFGVTGLLGNDHLKVGVELPTVPEPEVKEMSKSEMKRLAKKKGKEKEDPTKPVETVVVGAVDYSQDYFGQRVNLTVSGQLNVETHACALSDVYTFGPTFRAEDSRTYRHLSEFWMIEPEIAFADLTVDINLAEDYLKYCVKFALENCAEDLEFFENSQHGEKGLRDRLRNVLHNEFKVCNCCLLLLGCLVRTTLSSMGISLKHQCRER